MDAEEDDGEAMGVMGNRVNRHYAGRAVAAWVREMVIREGVAATANALGIGREQALAVGGSLPTTRAIVGHLEALHAKTQRAK